ncbi:uncharacterized protein LOC133203466 [Saccostrea echinata]|uniref:uncharacterized protein LOC133203466 n=1 Tax=Saccostrea echinata TaxID=191078 RepID=UPI002A81B1A1|nr:uncharacterized protein LOC133203466 [Saccostrea echinata]
MYLKLYLQIACFLIPVPESVSQQNTYHGEFHFKVFGKLSKNESQTVFSAEGTTFARTLEKCSQFCVGDQRCIGIELCQIRNDLFQCRVCCEWKKIYSNYYDDQPNCKYLEIVMALAAHLSTVFGKRNASFAVDGVTKCSVNELPHTMAGTNPWIRIDLAYTTIVTKVIVYNRIDCCGERLHDVSVNVNEPESARNFPCGFYPGPAINGDRILFLCENGAKGESVTIIINSKNGQESVLHVCEVEVFGKR